MNEQDRIAFQRLINKVNEQEHTIAQLVKIIAATNRRITAHAIGQQDNEQTFSKV